MPLFATRLLRTLLAAAITGATLLLAGPAQAQAPAWDLATTGSLTQVNGNSYTRAITTDAGGNVYVTGTFSGSVAFGSTVLLSVTGSDDLFVAKYVPGTNTWAWAQRGGGIGIDAGYGIAVQGTSVYVTGYITNNAANANVVSFGGTTPATSTAQVNGASAAITQDIVLAKYTDNGTSATLGWTQVGGGNTNFEQGTGVAVNGTSVYLTGFFYNSATNNNGVLFGGGGTTAGTVQVNGASATASQDLLLAKYTDNGATATLSWVQTGGGSLFDQGNGVAVSGTSVYVTGYLTNTATNANGVLFGGNGTTTGTVPQYGTSVINGPDLVLAKYTDNGTTATFQWSQVGGGTNSDYGQGVAVSGSSVYVTGYLTNTATNALAVLFGGSGTTAGTVQVNGASATASPDLLLAKYTDNGPNATLGWTQVGGGTGYDDGVGVVASGTSVYVAGNFTNSTTNANSVVFSNGGGSVAVPGAFAQATIDLVVAKYQDNGASASLAWTQVSGSTGNDQANGVAMRGVQVYLGGYVTPGPNLGSALSFGAINSQSVQGTVGSRAVLGQVTDAGSTGLWTGLNGATNGGTSVVRATTTDASGNVLVAGSFAGEVDFGSTRLSSAGGNDVFVAKYVPGTGTWAWAQRGGGIGDDAAYGVAVSNASVYVTGSLTNTNTNAQGVSFGGTSPATSAASVNGIAGTSTADLVLAKYTDNGATATLRWTQTGGGTDVDRGYGVAASGTSVYVTGSISNSRANTNAVAFGGNGTTSGTVIVNGASTSLSEDLILAKYTDNGATATLGWTQVGGGFATDRGQGVAVSGTSVYVTGFIFNTVTNNINVLFGGGGTTLGTVQVNGANASNLGNPDLVLAKYTDQGSTGALVWTQVGGGTREDVGYGVAVQGTSVYVAGQLRNDRANGNGVLFGGGGTTAGTVPQYGATATASLDVLLAKYTDNGPNATLGWTQVGGGTLDDVGYAVAATATSVYVAGSINNSTANSQGVVFGGAGTAAGTVAVPGATAIATSDVLLARYLDNGSSATLGWTRTGGGLYNELGLGVAVSGQAVYVSGTASQAATFAPLSVNLFGSIPTGLLARVTDTGTLAVAPAAPGAAGLALYPNPATNRATLTGAEAGATVQVLDALGRVVLAATADATGTAALTLPARLAAGVYVVRAGTAAVRLAVQ